MMLYDSKEDAIREEFFHTIRLSKTNREIAGKYLHMDDAEAPELLEKAEHQDLASAEIGRASCRERVCTDV